MRTIRLVVEDSAAYRHLITTAFRKHSDKFQWELTSVARGEDALEMLFAEEAQNASLPHIILLNWNLPKVSGNEVLLRIKEHPKFRKIPLLVFSSSAADKDIHHAYASYANGYITKPGSIQVMEEIVEAVGQFWVAIAQIPQVLRSRTAG